MRQRRIRGCAPARFHRQEDPKGRGWQILETAPGSILMRRTQTFNCVLQEGLLAALVNKTDVRLPRISHVRCTRRGDEYCEYRVTWVE